VPELLVHFSRIEQTKASMNKLKGDLDEMLERFTSIQRSLDWEIRCEMHIDARMTKLAGKISGLANVSRQHEIYLANADSFYKRAEKQNGDNLNSISANLYGAIESGTPSIEFPTTPFLVVPPINSILQGLLWAWDALPHQSRQLISPSILAIMSGALDAAGYVVDSAQTGLKVLQPLLANISFVEDGLYTIVKGIPGGSIPGIGARYRTSNISGNSNLLDLLDLKVASNTLDDISKGLFWLSTGLTVNENFTSGGSLTRKVTSSIVDIVKDALIGCGATAAGAAIGTAVCPVVGTAVGAVIGFASTFVIGLASDLLLEADFFDGKSVMDFAKDYAEMVGDAVVGFVKDAWGTISEVATDAWDTITDVADDAWNAVGDFFGDVFSWAF
jgi:hypothetical protein